MQNLDSKLKAMFPQLEQEKENDIEELKEKHNAIIARLDKAQMFLDNPNVSAKLKEKYTPEINKLVQQFNQNLESIGHGNYTIEEATNGFPKSGKLWETKRNWKFPFG